MLKSNLHVQEALVAVKRAHRFPKVNARGHGVGKGESDKKKGWTIRE